MPPILFVRVYEMILNSGFPKNVQYYLGKLHLMSATYRLIGATLYRQGHYTGVINTSRHGWLFYDGLKGHLRELTAEIFNDYRPSNLVFAQDNIKYNS